MSEVLVQCESVSKKFCRDLKYSLYYGMRGLAAEILGRERSHSRLRKHEFWAVKDVSFELRRGECLGLIGHNGAGKSTLLKMLNGLIKPDEGRITMRGQTAAMIALGTGFNPILTGRENIYISSSLRGLTRRQIREKLDAIVDFAEMKEFIDTPVQSYSSGMMVRLGFAVAITMQPDVLLIDEVLAVGDLGFKEKAYNEIYRIIQSAAVIFVSHSIPQISKICTRGILMRRGKVEVASDQLEPVIDGYFNEFCVGSEVQLSGSGKVQLLSISARDSTGALLAQTLLEDDGKTLERGTATADYGKPLRLELRLRVSPEVRRFVLMISFYDSEMKMVAQCVSLNQGVVFADVGPAPVVVRLSLDRLCLNRGRYKVDGMVLAIADDDANVTERLLRVQNALDLRILTGALRMGGSPVQLQGEWRCDPPSTREPVSIP